MTLSASRSLSGLVALWALAGCGAAPTAVDAVEICDNLRDDDGDTLIDCADADCVGSCPENCVDALDNDGDGDVDCADADCDGLCPEDCTDDRDNDGDLLIDCNDTDCLGFCPEDCNDGVDNDGDGLFDCVDPDCADPSCPELCTDNADNDGDGLVDCDDPSCDGSCTERCSDLRDNDGDGFTDCEDVDCDGECPEHCTDGRDNDGDGVFDCEDPDCDGQCDQDGDGYLDAAGGGLDCDDTDAAIHPFAREICNAADDDCDGLEDEADPSLDPATLFTFYPDLDGDGYGDDSAASGEGCVPPSGAVTIGGDCADGNPARNPAALEVCDLVDNDCDLLTDDADPDIDPLLQQTWYRDIDGDGYGDAADTVQSCLPPTGYVGNGEDCHVFDARYTLVQDWYYDGDGDGFGSGAPVVACIPPADHVADDTDCDDADPLLSPATPRYRDADLDGYGSPLVVVSSCSPVPGYVDDDQDCNDASFAVNPTTVWQLDGDRDGFGHPLLTVTGCDPVEGHALNGDDCDDENEWTNPAALELCDGEDNDCDTEVDEDAVDRTWYLDLDGDGAGNALLSVTQCSAPGFPSSLVPGDCDDSDPLLNLDDADGDGLDTCSGDCNDFDPTVRPGAPDVCEDGVDADCDGSDTCVLTFSGIRTDLAVADLVGWRECWTSLYFESEDMSVIRGLCDGSHLLMTCRPIGSSQLTVAAAGHRDDVLFDVGTGASANHRANGVAWYYDDMQSWGFFEPGDGVNRNSCDVETGVFPERRLCWHTSSARVEGGYRCGATRSLNSSSAWERLVFTADL